MAIRLYRSTLFLIIYIFLIGINSYGWSRSGVNHVLIFEIDPRDHLDYQQFLETGTFLGIFWFLSVIAYVTSVYLDIDYFIHPFALISFLLIYFLNPFPVLKYSSRTWLLNTLWGIVSTPFNHVAFAHFWLADQLTSFEFLFTDSQFFICWFLFQAQWAPFRGAFGGSPCIPHNSKDLRNIFNIITLLLMCLPSWWRFLQCLRRYKDTHHAFPHLANALKYATTFFDVGALTLRYYFSSRYKSDWENPFFYLWFVDKLVGTCYKFGWDIKMDWGFLDKNAGENKFLRETIVYSSKYFYYFAFVQNFLLRFVWIARIFEMGFKNEIYKELFVSFFGFLEMYRRFVWNFFRLENEHLNNCGQFRAVRDISISPIQVADVASIEKMMDDEDGVVNREKTLINYAKQSNSTNEISKKHKSSFWTIWNNEYPPDHYIHLERETQLVNNNKNK